MADNYPRLLWQATFPPGDASRAEMWDWGKGNLFLRAQDWDGAGEDADARLTRTQIESLRDSLTDWLADRG